MAHIKSSKKDIVSSEKARQRNVAIKSRMRTHMKDAMTAIEAKDKEAVQKILPIALSELDRAAKKGVLHKNSAARKKSTLQHRAAAIL